MQAYFNAARRHGWVALAILALVWGSGFAVAYIELATTYESKATVWALRASPELTATNLDDPSVPIVQTVAAQQAELLNQLAQTRSFVRDVVERTSLAAGLHGAADRNKYLDDIGKRLRVQTLGANMLSVTFTAHDPRTPAEVLKAAIAVRTERVAEARIAAATAVATLYRREFDTAQAQAAEAQRRLDAFDGAHTAPLNATEDSDHSQLRLALNLAQSRVSDLRARAGLAVDAPTILEMSGIEFQVVDQPEESSSPNGGSRPAMMIAAVALMAGIALVALMIVVSRLLTDNVAGPADIGRLAPAQLFATVPRVGANGRREREDLRAALAAKAFIADDSESGAVL